MNSPDHEERLIRIEERLGFTDHAADQLSTELARAYTLIDRLSRRINDLERRIGVVESGSIENAPNDPLELPPHSAGNRAELEESKRQAGYTPDD
jgi:uncharacterized coiled-coil protein SlyX